MRRRLGRLGLAAWFGWGIVAVSAAIGMSSGYGAGAQTAEVKPDEEAAIRAALTVQIAAWNRGDIPEFMATYEDSPETTFVGATTVKKGFTPILERYKKNYPNKEQMGTLSFSELDVRLLPSSSGVTEFAVVTGHFHLKRTAKSEGTRDEGIFSLVWHKGASGWKIVLDHTS